MNPLQIIRVGDSEHASLAAISCAQRSAVKLLLLWNTNIGRNEDYVLQQGGYFNEIFDAVDRH